MSIFSLLFVNISVKSSSITLHQLHTKIMAEEIKTQNNESVASGSADLVLEKKILKQVEFYFGNSNFRRDKFLRGKAEENSDGNASFDIFLFTRIISPFFPYLLC